MQKERKQSIGYMSVCSKFKILGYKNTEMLINGIHSQCN